MLWVCRLPDMSVKKFDQGQYFFLFLQSGPNLGSRFRKFRICKLYNIIYVEKVIFTLCFLYGSRYKFSTVVCFENQHTLLGCATPNLGDEFAVSQKSTISTTANFNPWTFGDDAKMQHWFVRPEYRYWFSEKYSHFFVSAHLIGGGFEGPFSIRRFADKYYKGSFFGAGWGLGYSFYIETSMGAGLLRFEYRTKKTTDSYSQDARRPHHYT